MAKEKSLVIVESPTKAKTIQKFLPKDFMVVASMGHVRDLPQSATQIPKSVKDQEWAKLGVNVENGFEPLYVTVKGKSKILTEIRKKMKEAKIVYLATDEDREGESISWHLLQLLKPKIPTKRMVFHEITKKAIAAALEDCRDIDMNLVKAQETRRILDRIYGYTLSPLLWKKISYGLSAGRVQSPGLKLLVERERERIAFVKSSYWDLKAQLESPDEKGLDFSAQSMIHKGKKIAQGKDFDEKTGKLKDPKNIVTLDEKMTQEILKNVKSAQWKVTSTTEKKSQSNPLPPFITSTLQQEGNRKLGMSSKQTMRTAQRLYEQGYITYMRTDSPTLSNQAIKASREQIETLYGKNYLSTSERNFQSKDKRAQEAHEAIRPAGDQFVMPKDSDLSGEELKLYDLIWKRTLASQMQPAQKKSMKVEIQAGDTSFQANGTKIEFPGYLKVYVEGKDDPKAALEDREVVLPHLEEGMTLNMLKVENLAHETRPPARFTEAALVQRLEKEGIGRPSTYATIIDTILNRGYARKDKNALVPTYTGLAVVQLLEDFFADLVAYGFTIDMENTLDQIAFEGKDPQDYLKSFFLGKKGLRSQVENKEKSIKPDEARTIRLPQIDGEVMVKVGRYGPYIVMPGAEGKKDEVHASIPEHISPSELKQDDIQMLVEQSKNGPEPIGVDPESGKNVYCLMGRYGAYLQLGEVPEDGSKPKRSSLPKPLTPQTVTLEEALKLLSLPRQLGTHPEKGVAVEANLGRFGPYVACDGEYRSLKKEDDLYEVTLERALELLAQEKKTRRGSTLLKDFGNHPKKKKKVGLYSGKYGAYLKLGTKNISLPDDYKEDEKALKLTDKEVFKIVDEFSSKKK